MKDLKDYILEVSILGDVERTIDDTDEGIKQMIVNFIKENYRGMGKYEIEHSGAIDRQFSWDDLHISDKPVNGKYIVDFAGNIEFYGPNRDTAKTLTNDLFVWGNIDGAFSYNTYNGKLETLEGGPRSVGGAFTCNGTARLKNLKGAPEFVGERCNINLCTKLSSLEGIPEHIGGHLALHGCNRLKRIDYFPKQLGGGLHLNHINDLEELSGLPETINGSFYINGCKNLKSLIGCPSEVNGDFNCEKCKSLDSLEGCPKNVAGNFSCKGCAVRFTKSQVQELCNVAGNIDAYTR
jgi:hypothetical protein